MKLTRKDFTHARDAQLHAVGIVRTNNPGWLKKALQREFTPDEVESFKSARKVKETPPRPRDGNVQSVCRKLEQREKIGFKKYGVTTERPDVDLLGWLNHLQQELMDATVYIEAAIQDIRVSGFGSSNEAEKSDICSCESGPLGATQCAIHMSPERFANETYEKAGRDLA